MPIRLRRAKNEGGSFGVRNRVSVDKQTKSWEIIEVCLHKTKDLTVI